MSEPFGIHDTFFLYNFFFVIFENTAFQSWMIFYRFMCSLLYRNNLILFNLFPYLQAELSVGKS